MPKDKETSKRIIIALWCFAQIKKQYNSPLPLREIENHFNRFCEHYMLEYVRKGLFQGNAEGWNLPLQYRDATTAEFQEALKQKYSKQ